MVTLLVFEEAFQSNVGV